MFVHVADVEMVAGAFWSIVAMNVAQPVATPVVPVVLRFVKEFVHDGDVGTPDPMPCSRAPQTTNDPPAPVVVTLTDGVDRPAPAVYPELETSNPVTPEISITPHVICVEDAGVNVQVVLSEPVAVLYQKYAPLPFT